MSLAPSIEDKNQAIGWRGERESSSAIKSIKQVKKNNRRPTSVAMIMLDFNIGASKLFIEICDEGRDPDIYLGLYCRKKFFIRFHSQNITKIHRVALNTLIHYPLAFISEFYECFFGLERVWKRGNANDVSYGFEAIFSSYRRAVASSEESMLFVFLFPLIHEIENQDVKHILWRKINCNLIKCFQKNYEHQFL